jgi:hypothetical protein
MMIYVLFSYLSLSLSLPFVCMSSCLAFVAFFPSLLSAYIYVNLQYVVVVLPEKMCFEYIARGCGYTTVLLPGTLQKWMLWSKQNWILER